MVELYKLARRAYLRRERAEAGLSMEEDARPRGVEFHMANTMDVYNATSRV